LNTVEPPTSMNFGCGSAKIFACIRLNPAEEDIKPANNVMEIRSDAYPIFTFKAKIDYCTIT